MTTHVREALHLRVTGVVQGVGFRPFAHRLATELGLDGIVGNDVHGVFVEVEGPASAVADFPVRLRSQAPPLAVIDSIECTTASVTGRRGFTIVASRTGAGAVTPVSPDMAVCAACLEELWDPQDRRHLHPFITCTDCGPRFTITESLPYDRPGTTMAGFPMCAACRAEYDDPGDRRYHAQPIGCHDCGPTLTFESSGDRTRRGPPGRRDGAVATRGAALAAARAALRSGAVVAVKGVGGYHLACDATSDRAVGELRSRKGRLDKPFAVMVADVAAACRLADLGPEDIDQLTSPARPIVLATARPGAPLSTLVAPGNPLIGVMLPSAPLHHLLIGASGSAESSLGPLVMTSSNHSGEPICYRDEDVWERAGHIIDGVLAHDRPIHVPCDDSVVRVTGGQLLPIRRARGYAPLPVRIPPTGADILAVGGEMKNAFCVAGGERAWMSQHIGDLGNLTTLETFETSVRQFCELYRVEPAIVVVDAHPGYLGSRWARRHHAGSVVEVGHHHAHVASVMAEHGLDPDAEVIGMAFDGTGYGDDGTIWGGEILEATASAYRRVGHLATVPLPGGDAAVLHPWRVALAHLWAAGIAWSDDLPPVGRARRSDLGVLDRQLATGLACVPTSSMGRLFDAVSSLLGLRHDITYEAQAAIDLEHAAAGHLDAAPSLRFGSGPNGVVEAGPVLVGLIAAMRSGAPVGAAAAGFHLAVVDLVVRAATGSRRRSGSSTVVLSGGVWQNALLSGLARRRLRDAGFDVRSNRLVPPNDGGLALGQLFVAAHRARDGASRAPSGTGAHPIRATASVAAHQEV